MGISVTFSFTTIKEAFTKLHPGSVPPEGRHPVEDIDEAHEGGQQRGRTGQHPHDGLLQPLIRGAHIRRRGTVIKQEKIRGD